MFWVFIFITSMKRNKKIPGLSVTCISDAISMATFTGIVELATVTDIDVTLCPSPIQM